MRTRFPRAILALAALLVGVCGVKSAPAAIHEFGAPPRDAPYGLLLKVPAGSAGGAAATESTSTFGGFVRCPAESGACTNPFASIPMENDTAYFRNVLVGAWTSISGAADGEVWSTVFFDPEGGSTDFPLLDFYANYGGYQNCFVTPWQIICGSTSIDILWFMQIQCEPTGD